MKNNNLEYRIPRILIRSTVPFLLLIFFFPTSARPVGDLSHLLTLRQEYNAISARIDSLVRAMEAIDPEALSEKRLPGPDEGALIPDGMEAVLIFWADDEARVWLNGFLIGETRLTPVEVTIPALYFRAVNRITVRSWDTDWVESGFLCGLYLRDRSGRLHPILGSDRKWSVAGSPVQEITYAHPVPDIPGGEVIWGPQLFGTVRMERTFDHKAITNAASKAELDAVLPSEIRRQRMDYHAFLQSLAVLKERRNELKTKMQEAAAGKPNPTAFKGEGRRSLSLTLGKAGPLREAMTLPVAEGVQRWAQALSETQKRLLYPERRDLKGEEAANPAFRGVGEGDGKSGERQLSYRPPSEQGTVLPLETGGEEKATGTGEIGTAGSGSGEGDPRKSRLGLWVPTLLLMIYVAYTIIRWEDLTGGNARYPWN